MIAQFATSMQTPSSSTGTSGNCMGDPWLQIIPPVKEFSRDYGLLTPELEVAKDCPANHFVTILVKTTQKDGIRINNKALDWTTGVDVVGTGFSFITERIRRYHLSKVFELHVCTCIF
jgi:hypothetical protein